MGNVFLGYKFAVRVAYLDCEVAAARNRVTVVYVKLNTHLRGFVVG